MEAGPVRTTMYVQWFLPLSNAEVSGWDAHWRMPCIWSAECNRGLGLARPPPECSRRERGGTTVLLEASKQVILPRMFYWCVDNAA